MFLFDLKNLKLQTFKDLWANYQEVCIVAIGVIALLFLLWIIAIIGSKKNKKRYKKLVKLNLQKEIETQNSIEEESKEEVLDETIDEEVDVPNEIETPEELSQMLRELQSQQNVESTEEVQEEVVEEEPVEVTQEETIVEEEPVEESQEETILEEEQVEEPVIEDQVEEPVQDESIVEEEPVEESREETIVEEEPIVEEPVQEEKPAKKSPTKKSPAKKATSKTTSSSPKELVQEEVKETSTPAKKPSNRGKGKYEIVQDAAGYKYNLKASNGETLIVSESYTTLSGCKNAIKRLQENAHEATVNIEKDKNGNFQFHIVKGTRTIAHSANYSTKVSATNASKAFLKYIETDVIKVVEESSNDLEEVIVDSNDISTDTIGKIVVSKEGSNYLYKLYANNGQVICMSPVYKALTTIEKSIATFKESVYDGKFFILKDKNENYQFKLYNKNSRLIMTGESFQSADACRSNIISCHRFAKNAPVEYPEE